MKKESQHMYPIVFLAALVLLCLVFWLVTVHQMNGWIGGGLVIVIYGLYKATTDTLRSP